MRLSIFKQHRLLATDFFSWTGVGAGSYSGTSNPFMITMNGPITETGNFVLPAVGDVASSIMGASAGSVWFVLPDYRGPYHTPAAKCGGAVPAELSDYSAGGYVLGLLSNPQNQILDTSSSMSQISCGNPTGSSGTIVTLAGRAVNEAVNYYENVEKTSPVYYANIQGVGYFVVRATGQRFLINAAPGSDYFLIEAFTDSRGRMVFMLYGYSWQGTLAAGEFFERVHLPTAFAVPGFLVHLQVAGRFKRAVAKTPSRIPVTHTLTLGQAQVQRQLWL